MIDPKPPIIPLSDDQLDEINGGATGYDCGVPEGQFPLLGTCCTRSTSISGTVYKDICRYCGIWSSLPDSANLRVTFIIECALYGYGKRIKE